MANRKNFLRPIEIVTSVPGILFLKIETTLSHCLQPKSLDFYFLSLKSNYFSRGQAKYKYTSLILVTKFRIERL